jgi:hypothetical protein
MQERAEREFTATGHSHTVLEEFFQNRFQHSFVPGQMQLRQHLTRKAASAWPEAQSCRDGRQNPGPADIPRESPRHPCFPPGQIPSVSSKDCCHRSRCPGTADPQYSAD